VRVVYCAMSAAPHRIDGWHHVLLRALRNVHRSLCRARAAAPLARVAVPPARAVARQARAVARPARVVAPPARTAARPLRRVRLSAALSAAAILVGCSGDRALEVCPEGYEPAARFAAHLDPLPQSPYDLLFKQAGTEFGVDAALLKALAWVETRFHMAAPAPTDTEDDHHGQPPAWGVMALRGERLARAAQLAGLDVEQVRVSPAANIRAAAALLASEAAAAGVAHLAADAWAPALERFSGIDLPHGRVAYAWDAVLPAMGRARAGILAASPRRHGVTGAAPAGAATAGAHQPAGAAAPATVRADCIPRPPTTPPGTLPPTLSTTWRPSPNYDSRAPGVAGQVAMIIVHTCEGSYVGCWSWLSSAASGVSAHYVIDEDGGEVSYLVTEPMRAWHIGARYDCALNRGRRCDLADVQSNHFTVGIEHAGYAAQPSFPTRQIELSAQLTCAITKRHGIPRDNQHIVAHGQLQPWNRTDPGPNWPWVRYLALTQRYCGEIVADDDAALNDAAHARVTVTAAWAAASETAGYFGVGYRWAPTSPDSDDAVVFELHVETAGRYTAEARWTAGGNRAAAARYTVRNAGGTVLATADLDQRVHHDQWRAIAALDLMPGWYRIDLSRSGAAGHVVIADAVRFIRAD
jgi:N-acetyl-anhydromuramyl-L-alanine amidase AmpD